MSDSVGTLIKKVMHGEDAGIRREALIELGYEESPDIYPLLIEQLDDPNSSIQHAAVISLGRYGNPLSIEELIKPKILHSPVVNLRWATVAALGKLGDYRVIEHLLKAVEDSEWIVRNQAVTELKDKIRDIIELKDARYARILVRLLALENEEIVNLVIEGFVELGDKSIGLLLDALKSPSDSIRENAATALGRIKSREAVAPLIELLSESEWKVRRSAAEALGQIGDKRAIEPLIHSLRDNVEKVQQEAVESVVRFSKLSTGPLLNALTYEKNKFTLRAILQALGAICDIKAVPALVGQLSNSYFIVRRTAQRALARFGAQVTSVLLHTLSYNKSAIDKLLKDAEIRDDPALQIRAIRALGGLEDHRAVRLLKDLVEKGWPEVQDAAMQALIQIGCAAWGRCGALIVLRSIADESITSYLVESLSDDSDNVRLEAVRTLAKVDGSSAIDPLILVARKDRDPYIRYEAVRLLRRIGVGYPQVLELALTVLKDSHQDVRSQAARLLGNFHDDRSIEPLVKATADPNWNVRESAENALFNFGKKAVLPLIKALSSRAWTTRFRAARLLGEIGDSRAIDPLEKILKKKGEKDKVLNAARISLNKLRGSIAA
jgi:HEAT repeat protein